MADFELRAALTATLEQVRRERSADAGRVVAEVSPEVPGRLRGHEARLKRLLSVMIGRALGLCRGPIRVSVCTVTEQAANVQLRFELTGVPTRPESLPPALNEVDLALWKRLAARVVDEFGIGDSAGEPCWWFQATFARSDAHTAPRPRVLVVEDNFVNQKVAVRLLEQLGYAADVVPDGAEAVVALQRRTYGMVLMDCHMPVMDGYEATQRIRLDEAGRRRTPIVALTAHALASNRQQCLELGMDDFVAKPISRGELRRVVERWLVAPPQ